MNGFYDIYLDHHRPVFSLTPVFRIFGRFVAMLSLRESTANLSREECERLFGRVHSECGELIKRVCWGYARSSIEWEDLYQDTLVNIWQGLSRFRGNSELRTWVYRIVLNTCVSTLRKRCREVELQSLADIFDMADESVEQRERVMELHESIAKLNVLDKAVVMMWLDDFSYDEIASLTGLGRNTVATKLRRAKLKILKDYEG